MARTLERMPTSPTAKYPWAEWLDGRIWMLVPGDDFTAKPSTMRQNAKLQARSRGGDVKVKTHRDDQGRECLVVQFIRS